jgi:hypothetical protein
MPARPSCASRGLSSMPCWSARAPRSPGSPRLSRRLGVVQGEGNLGGLLAAFLTRNITQKGGPAAPPAA